MTLATSPFGLVFFLRQPRLAQPTSRKQLQPVWLLNRWLQTHNSSRGLKSFETLSGSCEKWPPGSSHPTANPPVRKESKLSEPPQFDGKSSEYATFINHCDLYFRTLAVTFDSDYVKVAYVIAHLPCHPAEWGHFVIDSSSDLLHDSDAFKGELASMYADKQRRKASRRRFMTLKQTGSATEFKASQIFSALNNDDSRFALFTNGLKGCPRPRSRYRHVRRPGRCSCRTHIMSIFGRSEICKFIIFHTQLCKYLKRFQG